MKRARQFDVLDCELDGVNLIEASAGTGKTWNICGLYLRLLLEREHPVQNILVVTFTNAATAELRERIRGRLVEMLAVVRGVGGRSDACDHFVAQLVESIERRAGTDRDKLALRLDEALQCFDEAAIFTIHGFCQRALADAAFSAGQPLSLQLVPDASETTAEAVRDFWRRRIAADDLPEALAAYLREIGDSPARYAALVARSLAKPLARHLWPAALDEPADLDAVRAERAFAAARATWLAQRERIVGAVTDALPGLHAGTYKAASVAESAQAWDTWLREGTALASPPASGKLELLAAGKLASCTRKGCGTPVHAFFDQADALLQAREAHCAELELARLRLVRELVDTVVPDVRRRKRERRIIAYDDMLYNLHAALAGDAGERLVRALRGRFAVALVDEFQDTDPLQFAIFDRLYGNGAGGACYVGDPKQAIYSFRNADLHAYLGARATATAQYTLVDNQRSSESLIAALNGLFSANPSAFMLEGLDYHPVSMGARPRRRFDDRSLPRPALQVWMLPQGDDGEPLPKRSARSLAVRATAAEVARLIGEAAAGRIDIDGQALAPGDIAVLVRSHAQGSELKRELAALDVGSVELSQASVFASTDAEEVERVLIAVNQPSRESLLRAALSTEMIGCDAARIAEISANEDELDRCLERFADYRDVWHRQGVGVMFRRLLSDHSVSARMLCRPDGERRLTNLLHLGELIHQAAAAHESPDALLRWLQSQRREASPDEAVQLRLESDRNLVQIVTIHKAKGLEFPVVFCPLLWDGRRGYGGEQPEGSEYHADDGEAVIDFRRDADLGSNKAAIKSRLRLEESAETLRLFYVALTRAVHRCYLVAGTYMTPNRGKPAATESTRSLLNWLVAGRGHEPAAWFEAKRTPADIAAAWTALARQFAPHLGIETLPVEPGTPIATVGPAPESLAALAPPASIERPWRFASFSSLAGGAASDGPADDHDSPAVPAPRRHAPPPADLSADDILRFPLGPSAGDCLHAVFEAVDFTEPWSWSEAIEKSLYAHPQRLPGVHAAEQTALLARMAAQMLSDVTQTRLPDGIVLATIPRSRRLAELSFSLSAPRVSASVLNATLKRLGYEVPRFGFADFHGYLKGVIDLVFEHRGRYYLLDWKSNHLGYAAADYARGELEAAMAEHGYHLQYLLYALALDRYLAHRLRGYRREAHFGGVLYLFVRGVRPHWLDADGSPTGVFHHLPSPATLATLDSLFVPPPAVGRR